MTTSDHKERLGVKLEPAHKGYRQNGTTRYAKMEPLDTPKWNHRYVKMEPLDMSKWNHSYYDLNAIITPLS